jgi:hypothetical protein
MKLTRDLLALRNTHRALQVGDFVLIPADRLLAFSRITDSVADTVVVVANPTNEPVTELLTTRDGFIQDVSPVRDALSGETVEVSAGLMTVTVPPKTVRVFVPVLGAKGPNYYRYKRIP